MRFFTRFLDVICFVIGPALLLASIFDFGFREAIGENSIAVAYVYSDEARTGIAIAAALIATGVLRWTWAKKG